MLCDSDVTSLGKKPLVIYREMQWKRCVISIVAKAQGSPSLLIYSRLNATAACPLEFVHFSNDGHSTCSYFVVKEGVPMS